MLEMKLKLRMERRQADGGVYKFARWSSWACDSRD